MFHAAWPSNRLRRQTAWHFKREYGKAIADFSQASRLDPQRPTNYMDLAWLQATCPDERYRNGKKAVENAEKYRRLTKSEDIQPVVRLACAYAESGDFAKAREWAEKAIAMARDDKDKQELRARLELFKQNKPYREEP